jgi:beta-mannanase
MPVLSRLRAACAPRRALALLCALPFLFQLLAPAVGAAATPIALGIYTPGAPGDPSRLDAYKSRVGVAPAIVMWYQDWAHGDESRFPRTNMETVTARGAMPLLTWEPWDWAGGGVNQPSYSLAAIAGGAHDNYIRQWARDAATWNKPFYLRFAHEMNGDWYPWAAKVNGNSAAAYVEAWRHVVTIFRQEGATNVRWVWSANVAFDGSTPLNQLYPGDEWVDWVALDGYNWGNTQSWSAWQSLADLFVPSHDELARLTGKPLMISEVASTESGGNKADWITQGFMNDLPKRLPNVRAVVWFNENKESDWEVNSSQGALKAWKKVAASSQYKGRLP